MSSATPGSDKLGELDTKVQSRKRQGPFSDPTVRCPASILKWRLINVFLEVIVAVGVSSQIVGF